MRRVIGCTCVDGSHLTFAPYMNLPRLPGLARRPRPAAAPQVGNRVDGIRIVAGMGTIDLSACPSCAAPPGSLRLSDQFVAAPIGSFSLAGVGTKVTATRRPVLSCGACGLEVTGVYDPDGRHVTFTPPAA
jgi:hypothetical protein